MERKESQDTGSAPDNVGNESQGSNQNENDGKVDYKSFDKLVGQLKKQKELNDQLSTRVNAFETEKKQIEESKLVDQGEYKKLLELKARENATLTEQLNGATSQVENANKTLIDAQKLQAVYEQLPGKIKNPKYMNFIDLDGVAYNPETREVDLESAKMTANAFVDSHKELIDTSHVGRLPHGSTSTGQPLLKTYKDLPLTDMRGKIGEAVRQAKLEQGLN